MKSEKTPANFIVNGILSFNIKNEIIFLHHEHSHHHCSYRSRKNHFLYQSKQLIKQMASLK